MSHPTPQGGEPLVPLWSDDDIANDAKRASSNPTVQAQIRSCLLFMRHGYEAKLAQQAAQIDALRQELAGRQGWTPVNPVGMVNDEYADAEIKLCYRRLTPASQEAAVGVAAQEETNAS